MALVLVFFDVELMYTNVIYRYLHDLKVEC